MNKVICLFKKIRRTNYFVFDFCGKDQKETYSNTPFLCSSLKNPCHCWGEATFFFKLRFLKVCGTKYDRVHL